jgi:hypothetical protein
MPGTKIGSLSAYLASAWTETGDIAALNIHFAGTADVEWFDDRKPDKYQITITLQTSPRLGMYSSGRVMTAGFRPIYELNCWKRIPPGSNRGSVYAGNVERMMAEVVRVFVKGHPDYGGSLTPFGGVFPLDDGRPITVNIEEFQPMELRYRVLLEATRYV